MKITDYDRVSSLNSNDVLLLDGSRGTKTIYASDVTKESKVLIISCGTISSLPVTITDSRITSDMGVVKMFLGVPSAQRGTWTVTTSNGSVTINGSLNTRVNGGSAVVETIQPTVALWLEKVIS